MTMSVNYDKIIENNGKILSIQKKKAFRRGVIAGGIAAGLVAWLLKSKK